jgi:hypothetical protein
MHPFLLHDIRIAAGANGLLQDSDGETALHKAASAVSGHPVQNTGLAVLFVTLLSCLFGCQKII